MVIYFLYIIKRGPYLVQIMPSYTNTYGMLSRKQTWNTNDHLDQ